MPEEPKPGHCAITVDFHPRRFCSRRIAGCCALKLCKRHHDRVKCRQQTEIDANDAAHKASQAALAAESERTHAIHEAERRVIEAAKEWEAAWPKSAGLAPSALVHLSDAIRALKEAERE